MASAYRKNGGWFVHYKDGTGRWRDLRTKCDTKTAAKAFARELEEKAQRQRHGLEPLLAENVMSFGELIDWWWKEYGVRLKSKGIKGFIEKNLRADLGRLALPDVTSARIESLLNAKTEELAPKSRNHLRGLIRRMFSLALRRGLWSGLNPADAVPRYRVPKRLPEYLRTEEVPRVLSALADHWRPLFATAVYTGMRQGELLGLRKSDVDMEAGTVMVARSYDSDTTKGGSASLLPIALELRPYLAAAIRSSSSELVFPRDDGSMQSRDLALDKVLRRALGRAGIVTGYNLLCRRKGCRHEEKAASPDPKPCPRCKMRLWPQALPRHVRFHDLRHTTATLLLKAGVPLATVQKILRHSDPSLTSEIYGHLDVDDMRAGIDRLSFVLRPVTIEVVPEVQKEPLPAPVAAGLLLGS